MKQMQKGHFEACGPSQKHLHGVPCGTNPKGVGWSGRVVLCFMSQALARLVPRERAGGHGSFWLLLVSRPLVEVR